MSQVRTYRGLLFLSPLVAALAFSACRGGAPTPSAGGGRSSAARGSGGAASKGTASGGVAFAGRDLSLTDVQARCAATGRPAMLYFTAGWCGYCRKLESETLPSPQVGRHMAGYVNVSYDADTAAGGAVARQFKVNAFPTLIRIDAQGNTVGRYEGFEPPAGFVQRIPAP